MINDKQNIYCPCIEWRACGENKACGYAGKKRAGEKFRQAQMI